FDVEVFSSKALEKAYEEVDKMNNESYKEHVTLYMYTNQAKFKVGYVEGQELYNKNYRLCVDTKEDFEVVERVYGHFRDEYVSAKDVVMFLDENVEVARMNSDIIQKY
ncbi:MAG: 3-deoxy-manno-octulosonate cytidylyltransferase, partial [Epulopiscium sp.]|nr:3-deoxy-manno-octulosonate cytidylyltransferase [Candidatus Epulonipiscium sp.]